jgi:hypothetical protein
MVPMISLFAWIIIHPLRVVLVQDSLKFFLQCWGGILVALVIVDATLKWVVYVIGKGYDAQKRIESRQLLQTKTKLLKAMSCNLTYNALGCVLAALVSLAFLIIAHCSEHGRLSPIIYAAILSAGLSVRAIIERKRFRKNPDDYL